MPPMREASEPTKLLAASSVSLCLSMIVRNEARCIRACLESVAPHISCYAIVDTGSTDETPQIIASALAGTPGVVQTHPWTGNFSFHRNQSLELARRLAIDLAQENNCWALFLDADEQLVAGTGPILGTPRKGNAAFWYAVSDEYRFLKLAAVKLSSDIQWRGALHEQITVSGKTDYSPFITDFQILYGSSGARRRNGSYSEEDLQQLAIEPVTQDREFSNAFHVARTHESRGDSDAALNAFRVAAACSRTDDEMFQAQWGQLRIYSESTERENLAISLAKDMLAASYGTRAEVFMYLARIAVQRGLRAEARKFAYAARVCHDPVGTLMYDAGANSWKPNLILAETWRPTGRAPGRGARYSTYVSQAINDPKIPPHVRDRIIADCGF